VTGQEIMVPPARFQRATFRLGAGVPSFLSVAPSRSNSHYSLDSLRFGNLNSPTLALMRLEAQVKGCAERGGGMPRHRTGAIFEDKDGRWWARVRYVDELGRRREKRRLGINKTDAKEKRDNLLEEIKKQGPLAFGNDRLTFEDLSVYFEKVYLIPAEYRDGRKITGSRDHNKFKSALKPLKTHFGRKRLRSITYTDLRNYRLARLRSKSKRDDKTPLSIATVNRELSLLRRMFSIARQQRWLVENPFAFGEALITPADERHRDRVLSRDEETRLLAECMGPREHLKGIVLCALDTGMRRGEILLLRWCDVDLKAGLLNVEAMHTKTLRQRQLAISVRLSKEMKRLYLQAKPKPTDRVFGLSNNFKRSFKTACKNAAITDLRFHDLRHTFATRLSEAGMTSDLIARLLGHSQTKTTYRYVNITEETAKRAVELLKQ
jgi:integrase